MNNKSMADGIETLLNHLLESVDNILRIANVSTGVRTQMINEIHDKEMAWVEQKISESDSQPCPYCDGAEPLVIGKTNDVGITIKQETEPVGPVIIAYGYDIHGSSSNGLQSKINYCPICGKSLRQKHREE